MDQVYSQLMPGFAALTFLFAFGFILGGHTWTMAGSMARAKNVLGGPLKVCAVLTVHLLEYCSPHTSTGSIFWPYSACRRSMCQSH